MAHESSQNGGIRLPAWALGSIVTALIAFLGFWQMWSVARADVENLKSEVSALKPLKEAVAVFKEQIPRMDRDIQEIKQTQAEIQKDIKILIQRGALHVQYPEDRES